MNSRDIGLGFLVILIWAGNLVALKVIVAEAEPLVALTLRFAATALIMLPFVRWPDSQTFYRLAQVAIMMSFLHQGLLIVGIRYMPAGIAGILLQSQILFSAFFGMMIFGERIGRRTAAGILLGLAGIVSFYGVRHEGMTVLGFWLLLGSGFCMAAAQVFMKRLPTVPPATFIFVQNGVALPFVFVTSLALGVDGWQALPSTGWTILGVALAYQVLIVSASHFLWQQLLARNPLNLVAPFVLLLPIFGVALGFLILAEPVTLRMMVGGLMTIAGVGIINLRRARKARQELAVQITE